MSGDFPATVTSDSVWVTKAGRYCWAAVYTGDTTKGIGGSSDTSTGECFVVNPVQPTLSTQAGGGGVVGTAVSDVATLRGTAPKPTGDVIHTSAPDPTTRTKAAGTITFQLYGPSDTACGNLVYTSSAVAVTGDGTYSPAAFKPTDAGTYHWVASYTGDAPNTLDVAHNTDCTATKENVTITTVASSLTSAQTWVPSDAATVTASAGGALAGQVTFQFFTSADCSGTPAWSATKDVAGASPQTVASGNAPAQTATGSFSWKVAYASTNPAQRSIPASCHETSALTITNGGAVTSP